MVLKFAFSRYTLLWMIILCYLLPLIALSAYQAEWRWESFAIGLLIVFTGALACFILLTRWDKLLSHSAIAPSECHSVVRQVDIIPQATAEDNTLLLKQEIENLQHELNLLAIAKEEAEKHAQEAVAHLDEEQQKGTDHLKEEQQRIRELQQTVAEQKKLLEKKQQQISTLETKVGDLTYEIKTLLQFAESHSHVLSEVQEVTPTSQLLPSFDREIMPSPSKQVNSSQEASIQLRRCIDIAQKITASRFNNQSLELSSDNFAIDLRRLCDSLRSENNCAIVLYSPKDEQFLFANNEIRTLTGWSPEKFTHSFDEIALNPEIWKQGVANLALRSEVVMKFSLKTKLGQEVLVQGHLGMIPTGTFRHHAIAVLYPIG